MRCHEPAAVTVGKRRRADHGSQLAERITQKTLVATETIRRKPQGKHGPECVKSYQCHIFPNDYNDIITFIDSVCHTLLAFRDGAAGRWN